MDKKQYFHLILKISSGLNMKRFELCDVESPAGRYSTQDRNSEWCNYCESERGHRLDEYHLIHTSTITSHTHTHTRLKIQSSYEITYVRRSGAWPVSQLL